MKDALQQQYDTIRNTILENVKIIRKLVEQADGLRSIVEQINGSDTETELKNSLEERIAEIDSTIGNLIGQTEKLFREYDKFVVTVFENKC